MKNETHMKNWQEKKQEKMKNFREKKTLKFTRKTGKV